METLKANKGPLLLPLLLVILTVAAYGIWNTLFSTATAASCLTLGRAVPVGTEFFRSHPGVFQRHCHGPLQQGCADRSGSGLCGEW